MKILKSWLIQSSGLRRTDEQNERLLQSLVRERAPFVDFGLIPFTTEVTNWENFPVEDDDRYFVYTSTKGLRVFTDESLDPTEIFVGADSALAEKLITKIRDGIYYDVDSFDMTRYLYTVGRDLLNHDCEVMTLDELMDKTWPTEKFVKPGKDLKLFTGGLLPANTTFRKHLETLQVDSTFDESGAERVLVSKPVHILAEWRFFVVAGEVVAQSQYRKHGELKIDKYVPGYVIAEANRLLKRYQPAPAFVMDLALTGDLEIKIVEYNCINCSGSYHADLGAVAWALRKV